MYALSLIALNHMVNEGMDSLHGQSGNELFGL
jgi:hypothetical protein